MVSCSKQHEPKADIKLFAMDCGSYDVADMKDLGANGVYDGQTLTMVNPCYLIRHPKGDLLWETGHIDSLADKKDGEVAGVWHAKRKVKLIEQLKQLNLTPKHIEFLALSHIHPDHSGNANKFSSSTFIVNEHEREYMFSEPINSYFGANYSNLQTSNTITFKDEHDVFSDGTVLIKSMPGHTPGSSVLLVKLNNAGNVLLTGDLYVHAKGRELQTMHQYNDIKQTQLSRMKFETLAKKENATVLIHHEKQDFDSLPTFPKYLN